MDFGDEFSGKTVVITGACGVIGRWLAQAFAREGMTLCLADRSDAVADLAGSLPGAHIAHVGDLTDDGDLERLVAEVSAEWGAPDILVNNAAVYPSGWLLDIDMAEWDRIFGINLRAPFALCRGFGKAMAEAGKGGTIINISSGAARKMRTTVVPYCVSKTALDRLTKGFALELAPYGIRVNALEPGFAPGSEASPLTEAHVEATAAAIPLGRISQPPDAAAAALYLSSSAAAYVTGATLTVDGGNSIGSQAVHQAKKTAL